jgi:hypothetical protein
MDGFGATAQDPQVLRTRARRRSGKAATTEGSGPMHGRAAGQMSLSSQANRESRAKGPSQSRPSRSP